MKMLVLSLLLALTTPHIGVMQTVAGDTLHAGSNINFIKVDGDLYHVERKTRIVKQHSERKRRLLKLLVVFRVLKKLFSR